VRTAIRHEIDLAELKLVTDLQRLVTAMGAEPWSREDWKALVNLFVRAMVFTVEAVPDARDDPRPARSWPSAPVPR